MRIREAQLAAFSKARLDDFVVRAVRHLAEHETARFEQAGTEAVERFVRAQIPRARSHGITTERSVCLYIVVAFTFGGDFDHDATFPWAASCLAIAGDGDTRARILYGFALAHA